jgi:hypothetical protein
MGAAISCIVSAPHAWPQQRFKRMTWGLACSLRISCISSSVALQKRAGNLWICGWRMSSSRCRLVSKGRIPLLLVELVIGVECPPFCTAQLHPAGLKREMLYTMLSLGMGGSVLSLESGGASGEHSCWRRSRCQREKL